ncbi:MAG: 2-C-methyl-D-erythritol 2,4-cyclodiphosphate synthase, partial [Bacteroidetes bacterium]|nr:2-C-methyl-D-erythritol 2,4-cyclodiphosphate synthase [Bacteroidota bacterium]
MNIRIGQGIDFHRLETGLNLWLGGINIPYERGCVAHSDGDVLLHAVCDALLGASGLRDIGFYFPDSDP